MAIRKIRTEDDPILRKKSRPVEVFDEKLWTLQYLLQRYLNTKREEEILRRLSGVAANQLRINPTSKSLKMAVTAVVTVPILFVYPFLQRFFLKGLMLGAVKG